MRACYGGRVTGGSGFWYVPVDIVCYANIIKFLKYRNT